MYEKEKEMVAAHEIFIDADNEFMNWLRISQKNWTTAQKQLMIKSLKPANHHS